MLSFHRGNKIGRILGGDLDNEELRIFQGESTEPDLLTDIPTELIPKDFFQDKKYRKLKRDDINTIKKHINSEQPIQNEFLENGRKEALKEIDNVLRKELRLENGKIQPVPNNQIIERLFVSGPSGSGKSTYISRFLDEVRRNDPNAEIFVISRVKNDTAFKHIKDIQYVEINEDLITDPLTPEEFRNPNGHKVYLIIDDIATIHNKLIKKSVQNFLDDCLECGRHMKLCILATNHFLTNFKDTRTLLNEATSVVFFPRSGSVNGIKRYLKEYAGLSPKQIKRILNLNSRWVCINRMYPNFIIYERGSYLLC